MPSTRISKYDVIFNYNNIELEIKFFVTVKNNEEFETFEVYSKKKLIERQTRKVMDEDMSIQDMSFNLMFEIELSGDIITISNDVQEGQFHIICYNKTTNIVIADCSETDFLDEKSRNGYFVVKNIKY